MKSKIRKTVYKSVAVVVAGAGMVACGSNPTTGMNPQEIAEHLGYTNLSPVQEIPSEARYSLEQVNSKAVIFDYGVGREFLVTFEQICLGIRSGGSLKTTSSDRMLEAGDSVVIDNNEYCRISEIYRLQGKS